MGKIAFVISLVLLSACSSSDEKKPNPAEPENTEKFPFADLKDSLPDGWCISTQDSTAYLIPQGVEYPLFHFEFRDTLHKIPGIQDSINPYLDLFFYSIADSAELDSIVLAQSVYSWCIPRKYTATSEYYVIYTPCYITSSSYNTTLDSFLVPYLSNR
jgi:hypothetical protein